MKAFAIGLLFVFSFFKILSLSTVLIHHTYIPTECEYEHWRFIEFELLLAEHTVHRPQSKYGWWSIYYDFYGALTSSGWHNLRGVLTS